MGKRSKNPARLGTGYDQQNLGPDSEVIQPAQSFLEIVAYPLRGRIRGGVRTKTVQNDAGTCYVFKLTRRAYRRIARRGRGMTVEETILAEIRKGIQAEESAAKEGGNQ